MEGTFRCLWMAIIPQEKGKASYLGKGLVADRGLLLLAFDLIDL